LNKCTYLQCTIVVNNRAQNCNVTLAGLLTCLLNHLQSVLNVAAQSVAGLRRSEHSTDALASFHWLRAPERIKFKLADIVYRALHGATPQYLSDQLQYVANLPMRRRGRLRSSTSNLLDVRPSRCVTVGDESFATADPRLGTVYLLTSGLPHHLQHFVGS